MIIINPSNDKKYKRMRILNDQGSAKKKRKKKDDGGRGRGDALNVLAKRNPAAVPPSLLFLSTCKTAKRVTYYDGGLPRGEPVLNTRLYVLAVPSGALLYEYFNLINSPHRSILSALPRD